MIAPYFKTRFSDDRSANLANPAKNATPISKISEISNASPTNVHFPLTADLIYRYQERVAIMEFDGGMVRSEAEKYLLASYDEATKHLSRHNQC